MLCSFSCVTDCIFNILNCVLLLGKRDFVIVGGGVLSWADSSDSDPEGWGLNVQLILDAAAEWNRVCWSTTASTPLHRELYL